MRHPERITALISQNGNADEEGLSDGWNPIQAYWKDPSPENRRQIAPFRHYFGNLATVFREALSVAALGSGWPVGKLEPGRGGS
jgi:hypothetical protein